MTYLLWALVLLPDLSPFLKDEKLLFLQDLAQITWLVFSLSWTLKHINIEYSFA